MNLGGAAVAALAVILGLGGVSTIVTSNTEPEDVQAIRVDDGVTRQDEDGDDLVAKDDD